MVVVKISGAELLLIANIWALFLSLAEWGNFSSVELHLHSSQVSWVFGINMERSTYFKKFVCPCGNYWFSIDLCVLG
jgi:hypothetical protein